MQHYGVCDLALNLTKSYLENRKQFDKSNLEIKLTHKNVPERSILRPL